MTLKRSGNSPAGRFSAASSACCLYHPSSGRSDVTSLCSAMMLFVLKSVITILALLATCVLVPQLPLGVLRLVLRGVGWAIQKRTKSRRELVLSRVRIEDEDFQARRSKSSSGGSGEDEDWEKVDSSSSSSGTAGNKQTGREEDWDGIIGFFHPFWYGWFHSPIFPLRLAFAKRRDRNIANPIGHETVTQAEGENVFFGKLLELPRNDGPGPLVPSIPGIMKSTRPLC